MSGPALHAFRHGAATLARLTIVLVVVVTPATRAHASAALALADSAWAIGDHDAAAAGYRRVLEAEPRSVRAAFRLGLIASWHDRLDTALVLVRQARELEPDDLEISLAEARLLSWTGRLAAADTAYRRVSVRHPGEIAPLLGRAQVALWRDDPRTAALLFADVLVYAPQDADALTGLASVHLREGRNREARDELTRALAADSTHHAARALQGEVDASLRPQCEATLLVSEDSDRNLGFSQSMSSSLWLAPGLWTFASAGALEASDPIRRASRSHGELGMTLAQGSRQVTLAGGMRALRPHELEPRSLATGRAIVTWRSSRAISIGIDASFTPLDETALLMGRGLSVRAAGASVEATLAAGVGLSASGGGARLSDGNRRHQWIVSLERGIPGRWRAGVLGRQLGYARRGEGYFSPDRFRVLEARLTRAWNGHAWTGRVQGGLGGQQTSRDAAQQGEWHLDARAGRRFGGITQVECFLSLSQGGWRADSGAYRSRTLGVSARFGL